MAYSINSKFINNTGYEGGVIYYTPIGMSGYSEVYHSTFINNHARLGGAINGQSQIINTTFIDNSAAYGGALYKSGGVINSTFINNSADYGGAISNGGTIINCTFLNNTAYQNGGAIYNSKNIYNSTFIQNKVHNTLEGDNRISWPIQASGGSGSAICTNQDYTTISKNTFKENIASTESTSPIVNRGYENYISNNKIETLTYTNTLYIYGDNINITDNIFTDNKLNTKTTFSTANGIIGNSLTLKATVTDTNNNKINEGNVIFKLNGITIKDNGKLTGSSNPLKAKVINGTATATVIPDLDMRNANKLTAKYIGTDNYNASESNQVKIQISQRNASIVVSSNVKTIKQGQILTITAKIYDTTNAKKSNNITQYNNQFVYFKVNGITLKDSKGQMLKVKIVNGTATTKYTIPIRLSGVTDGKTFTVKNHTILAGFYNKNYKENIRNTSTFQVERSNITITITNATVNNKTHKLSLKATIKDYLGNIIKGPNKCVIKINGISLKNGTQPMYYYSTDGILNIKNITIPAYNNYNNIEIVTQDRLAYKNQRNTTTSIKVTR